MIRTVTFCGHSKIPSADLHSLTEKLTFEIEKLIKCGAKEFLLGGYGSYDILCAKTVKKLKLKYPDIKSVLVIPYIDRPYDKDLYDFSEYPPIENTPKRFAISKRNEYMVQKSDAIVAYVTHNYGGAATTYSYAQKRKHITCINLNDM